VTSIQSFTLVTASISRDYLMRTLYYYIPFTLDANFDVVTSDFVFHNIFLEVLFMVCWKVLNYLKPDMGVCSRFIVTV